jgi:hypothetical protein
MRLDTCYFKKRLKHLIIRNKGISRLGDEMPPRFQACYMSGLNEFHIPRQSFVSVPRVGDWEMRYARRFPYACWNQSKLMV